MHMAGSRLSRYGARFEVEVVALGFEVLHKGWPDFVLVKGDEVIFVEVKPALEPHGASTRSYLTIPQLRLGKILERLGLTVRVAIDGDIQQLYTLNEYLSLCKGKLLLRADDNNGKHKVLTLVEAEKRYASGS